VTANTSLKVMEMQGEFRENVKNYYGIAHVGLPKTGSTYLQKHYLSKLTLPFFSTQKPFDWPSHLDFVRETNYLWYDDLLSNRIIRDSQQRRISYSANVHKKIPNWKVDLDHFSNSHSNWILSAEGLSGLSRDVSSTNMCLLHTSGVRKVIFIFRQQTHWALSLWRQFLLAEDRFARFVPFEDLFGDSHVSGIIDLDWNLYIDSMEERFGPQNVLALPYELLKSDPDNFFQTINVFLGFDGDFLIPDARTRENITRADMLYKGSVLDSYALMSKFPKLRRNVHKTLKNMPVIFKKNLVIEYPLTKNEDYLHIFQNRFRHSNTVLMDRIGYDLRSYGY